MKYLQASIWFAMAVASFVVIVFWQSASELRPVEAKVVSVDVREAGALANQYAMFLTFEVLDGKPYEVSIVEHGKKEVLEQQAYNEYSLGRLHTILVNADDKYLAQLYVQEVSAFTTVVRFVITALLILVFVGLGVNALRAKG